MTLSRRPGLFLSLRLTKIWRILVLYAAVVPLYSVRTALSTAFARLRIKSDAGIEGVGQEESRKSWNPLRG